MFQLAQVVMYQICPGCSAADPFWAFPLFHGIMGYFTPTITILGRSPFWRLRFSILFCQLSTLISLFLFYFYLYFMLVILYFFFFFFYFDTNVLYCTRINEINFFPLLVWTIRIVFKIMNEVYNLIDLRKFEIIILYIFQKSYEIF